MGSLNMKLEKNLEWVKGKNNLEGRQKGQG